MSASSPLETTYRPILNFFGSGTPSWVYLVSILAATLVVAVILWGIKRKLQATRHTTPLSSKEKSLSRRTQRKLHNQGPSYTWTSPRNLKKNYAKLRQDCEAELTIFRQLPQSERFNQKETLRTRLYHKFITFLSTHHIQRDTFLHNIQENHQQILRHQIELLASRESPPDLSKIENLSQWINGALSNIEGLTHLATGDYLNQIDEYARTTLPTTDTSQQYSRKLLVAYLKHQLSWHRVFFPREIIHPSGELTPPRPAPTGDEASLICDKILTLLSSELHKDWTAMSFEESLKIQQRYQEALAYTMHCSTDPGKQPTASQSLVTYTQNIVETIETHICSRETTFIHYAKSLCDRPLSPPLADKLTILHDRFQKRHYLGESRFGAQRVSTYITYLQHYGLYHLTCLPTWPQLQGFIDGQQEILNNTFIKGFDTARSPLIQINEQLEPTHLKFLANNEAANKIELQQLLDAYRSHLLAEARDRLFSDTSVLKGTTWQAFSTWIEHLLLAFESDPGSFDVKCVEYTFKQAFSEHESHASHSTTPEEQLFLRVKKQSYEDRLLVVKNKATAGCNQYELLLHELTLLRINFRASDPGHSYETIRQQAQSRINTYYQSKLSTLPLPDNLDRDPIYRAFIESIDDIITSRGDPATSPNTRYVSADTIKPPPPSGAQASNVESDESSVSNQDARPPLVPARR